VLFSPQILAARSKRSAAAGGGPPPVSGLLAWYDSSVFSSFTLSGATITNVTDQSGNGNHLGNGATSFRPTYSATGFNTSYPAMVFAAQQINSTSTFPMGTGNTLTFWLVGTMSSSSSTNGRSISYYSGTASDFSIAGNWIFARNGAGATAMVMRATIHADQSISYDTPYRFIGTIDSSGVMTLYLNGVASATATSSGNFISNGTLGIGGSVDSGGSLWSGSFAEIGISTAFTNSTDVSTLDSYLRTRWGL